MCAQHCSKYLGYIDERNRQSPCLMEFIFWRDVEIVGKYLKSRGLVHGFVH